MRLRGGGPGENCQTAQGSEPWERGCAILLPLVIAGWECRSSVAGIVTSQKSEI